MITTIETGWNNPIITISQDDIDLTLVEIGVQGPQGPLGPIGPIGPKGPQGDNLDFTDLTEQQKLELRGDVGNTSTNFTNVFYNALLN